MSPAGQAALEEAEPPPLVALLSAEAGGLYHLAIEATKASRVSRWGSSRTTTLRLGLGIAARATPRRQANGAVIEQHQDGKRMAQ